MAKSTKETKTIETKPKATSTKKVEPAKTKTKDVVVMPKKTEPKKVEAPKVEAKPQKAKTEKKAPKQTKAKRKEVKVAEVKVESSNDVQLENPVQESMDLKYTQHNQEEKQEVSAIIPQENVEIKQNDIPLESDVVSTPKDEEAPKVEKKKKLSKEYLRSPLNRVDTDPKVGLTEAQLQERIDKGHINTQKSVVTKSYFSIFRSNVLTLFNMINFFLGCAVLVFGQLKNALFLAIVIVNMVIGIFQEVRSKKTLEKMSIATAPTVDVIRNKNSVSSRFAIPADRIALDDIIILKQGAQVPVDCVVVGGQCDANESLLTGESDDIHKVDGDALYSGSTIQAGEVTCRVTAVGENSYSAKLLAEAKKFKKTKSKLMQSINWIIRIVTILIFPIGILLFLNNYKLADGVLTETVTKTVSSIIGMIPEGLMVLTSRSEEHTSELQSQ